MEINTVSPALMAPFKRGDIVTPRDSARGIVAWHGQRGVITGVCAGNTFNWTVEFDGAPVAVKSSEIRHVNQD